MTSGPIDEIGAIRFAVSFYSEACENYRIRFFKIEEENFNVHLTPSTIAYRHVQWRAEGGAKGATAPGIRPRGASKF